MLGAGAFDSLKRSVTGHKEKVWRIDWRALSALCGVLLAIMVLPTWWFVTNPRFHLKIPRRNACVANLKHIQSALEIYGLENKLEPTNRVSISDISGGTNMLIRPLINVDLSCPAGGAYSVSTIGESPRCSVPEHTL